jgi:hypothetical protein
VLIRFTKQSSQRRNRYAVSIYHADEVIEFDRNDQLSIPLTRLFRGTVFAENDKMAAAHVWIRKVGKYRHRRLVTLKAPITIVDAEISPRSIAERLVRSSLCPDCGGYMLDNHVEVWFISVRDVS